MNLGPETAIVIIYTWLGVSTLIITIEAKSKYLIILGALNAVCLCILSFGIIDKLKSAPIMKIPENAQIYGAETDGETIHLWARKPDKEHPQTYVFPYSDEAMQKLSDATADIEQGKKKSLAFDSVTGQFSIEDTESPEGDVNIEDLKSVN